MITYLITHIIYLNMLNPYKYYIDTMIAMPFCIEQTY